MKTKIIITAIALFTVISMQAQQKDDVKEIKIKTSAQCGMCKDRIEKTLAFEKGVVSSELDLDTKVVTVKYKESKITPDKIRKAIAKVGHDADDVPANAKAYEKLPACCKKPDDPSHMEH